MSIADTDAAEHDAVPADPLGGPHVHAWELRAVEFDAWGQVSLYECLGCPRVRYV
jgi:hypothetical protein